MTSTVNRPATPYERTLDEAIGHLNRGHLPAAREAARRAAALDPARLDALWLWGTAASGLWSFAEAERVFAEGARRAKPATPRQVSFLVQQARSLASLGRNAQAVAVVDQALEAGASDGENLNQLGSILKQAGLFPRAAEILEKAVAAAPRMAEAWYNLSVVQQYSGDADKAEKSLDQAKALAGDPNTRPAASPSDLARQAYDRFKDLDKAGDIVGAWTVLGRAAQASREQLLPPDFAPDGTPLGRPSRIGDWKADDDRRMVEAWIRHLPASRFQAPSPGPHAGPRRVFIIGLPRSGTTLVERILAGHSTVQAQGELLAFPLAVKMQTGAVSGPLIDPTAADVETATNLNPQALADQYVRETLYLSDGHPWAIDKLPHNYIHAGLIRLAFPDAVIVHVRRNPMDSLFGAYKQVFAFGYRWSYTLDDLASHYANYRLLMDHWRACFGETLVEVSLEAVIADPETEIRRLLEACGLPFEPACLTPHATVGAVATASSAQVRLPINAGGIGAWRRYATKLEPLKQRLIAQGFIDNDGNAL